MIKLCLPFKELQPVKAYRNYVKEKQSAPLGKFIIGELPEETPPIYEI